nr:Chain A, Lactotransferrin [Bos taurus]
WKLLSKAQEK